MANLIIKPTTGGSLILQDEGGTAAHTIDASGNHTLSGTTNNVGTVTGGTYNSTIGTSATFPAGHVVQTSGIAWGDDDTTVSSPGVNTWYSTVVTGSITPKFSNSSIIVHCHFSVRAGDSGGDFGYGYRFKRTATGISDSYPAGLLNYDGGGNVHSAMYRDGHQYTTLCDNHTFVGMDQTVSVADTAVTYTLNWASYNVATSAAIGGVYEARWNIFFQEIKR